jgi:hypothetical protein
MSKWWGSIEFELNEIKSWGIGERQIIVQRKKNEWVVWNKTSKAENDNELLLEKIRNLEHLVDVPMNRYLVEKTEQTLLVAPALADRSIIIRPGIPLTILPGQKTELYVSSPLWMSGVTSDRRSQVIDIPFWLPSDSWFGLSTMVGELCYAKYSDAKVELANIKRRSHRAITPIVITNHHEDPFVVQRINLPTPLLNLYSNSSRQFWTDKVHLNHDERVERPSLEIKQLDIYSPSSTFKLVNKAREVADAKTFMRSIRSLVA